MHINGDYFPADGSVRGRRRHALNTLPRLIAAAKETVTAQRWLIQTHPELA